MKDIINCTGCGFCSDGCPVGVAIPQYFAICKENAPDGKEKYYAVVKTGKTRASGCISCRQCQFMCPQQLPIIELLKKVAAKFE